jgi:Mn-containing catalase
MKAFTAALESMGKAPFSIGKIAPTPVLVDQYFNDSTGEGDEGETDARGPWNEGGDWQIVEVPELKEGVENLEVSHAEANSGRGKKQRASSTEPKNRKSA